MGESSALLLLSDPQGFMTLVNNHDEAARLRGLHTMDDILACEVLRHGIFNDPRALPNLIKFHSEVFMRAPIGKRRQIYGHVAMIVPQLGGWTVGAFTPFMLLDSDIGIVSTATVDYTSLGSLLDDDPMTRPRDVINMISKNLLRNPAAAIGGLVALGDPRVCELIRPLCHVLNAEHVTTVTRCYSGFTANCVVQFYLDWLDELVAREDFEAKEIFGQVAAGLYRLSAERKAPFVSDGLRPFPVPVGQDSDWPEIRRIDPSVFATSISGRLYDLELRESAPKIVPHVIRAFGLIPKTPKEQVALMQ